MATWTPELGSRLLEDDVRRLRNADAKCNIFKACPAHAPPSKTPTAAPTPAPTLAGASRGRNLQAPGPTQSPTPAPPPPPRSGDDLLNEALKADGKVLAGHVPNYLLRRVLPWYIATVLGGVLAGVLHMCSGNRCCLKRFQTCCPTLVGWTKLWKALVGIGVALFVMLCTFLVALVLIRDVMWTVEQVNVEALGPAFEELGMSVAAEAQEIGRSLYDGAVWHLPMQNPFSAPFEISTIYIKASVASLPALRAQLRTSVLMEDSGCGCLTVDISPLGPLTLPAALSGVVFGAYTGVVVASVDLVFAGKFAEWLDFEFTVSGGVPFAGDELREALLLVAKEGISNANMGPAPTPTPTGAPTDPENLTTAPTAAPTKEEEQADIGDLIKKSMALGMLYQHRQEDRAMVDIETAELKRGIMFYMTVVHVVIAANLFMASCFVGCSGWFLCCHNATWQEAKSKLPMLTRLSRNREEAQQLGNRSASSWPPTEALPSATASKPLPISQSLDSSRASDAARNSAESGNPDGHRFAPTHAESYATGHPPSQFGSVGMGAMMQGPAQYYVASPVAPPPAVHQFGDSSGHQRESWAPSSGFEYTTRKAPRCRMSAQPAVEYWPAAPPLSSPYSGVPPRPGVQPDMQQQLFNGPPPRLRHSQEMQPVVGGIVYGPGMDME